VLEDLVDKGAMPWRLNGPLGGSLGGSERKAG
jgi:hypothetical protein